MPRTYSRVSYIGVRFGRLTVVADAPDNWGRMRCVECLCDCGATAIIQLGRLRNGQTKSCGCRSREIHAALLAAQSTHGHTRNRKASPEYSVWASMVRRCTNPNDSFYKDYGGRGITVAPTWRESFEAFLADVGARPSRSHSLDRYPDNDGNYEPGNVRWATARQQARNTRRNRRLTIDGVTLCVAEWAERVGLRPLTIIHRLRRGWPEREAVFTPLIENRRTKEKEAVAA